MCNVTFFRHKRCRHTWAVVTEPCGPGMGFSTCAGFGSGAAKEAPALYETRSRPCPRCDLGGVYDANAARLVERLGWGLKWGAGPGRDDWGFEVKMGEMGGGGCSIL